MSLELEKYSVNLDGILLVYILTLTLCSIKETTFFSLGMSQKLTDRSSEKLTICVLSIVKKHL